MRKKLLNPKLVLAVAVWSFVISLPPKAVFAMPSDSMAVSSPTARLAQIDRIMTVLSRPEARTHLFMMGVSQKDLRSRLSNLDDQELATVAGRAETVKVSGDGLGIVVTILVIVLLVVLIMNLSNRKIVVTK